MAGGMAMSGRRLPPLERLRDIRDRFRRKFDTKWQNMTKYQDEEQSPSTPTPKVPREIVGKTKSQNYCLMDPLIGICM